MNVSIDSYISWSIFGIFKSISEGSPGVKQNLLMGETKTPHFYDFGIFETVAKPQNQLFVSLETPGHLKQIKKKPKHFLNIIFVWTSKFWNPKTLTCLEKAGTRKIIKIRLKNPKKWIWDQYRPENMKWFLGLANTNNI